MSVVHYIQFDYYSEILCNYVSSFNMIFHHCSAFIYLESWDFLIVRDENLQSLKISIRNLSRKTK